MQIYTYKGIKVLHSFQKLDSIHSGDLQKKIFQSMENGVRFIFDMGDCKYISSTGLRVLLLTAKKIHSLRGLFALANVSKEVFDIIQVAGFDNILKKFDTLHEAFEYLEK